MVPNPPGGAESGAPTVSGNGVSMIHSQNSCLGDTIASVLFGLIQRFVSHGQQGILVSHWNRWERGRAQTDGD